jgi:hypothetical protein
MEERVPNSSSNKVYFLPDPLIYTDFITVQSCMTFNYGKFAIFNRR